METLSKENFWDEVKEKYPLGFAVFSEWIDGYKEENRWWELFNCGSPHYAEMGHHNPKFHDLPMAMQIGVWIEFICERGGCEYEIEDLFSHDWREDIQNYLKMLHEEVSIMGK